MKSSDICKERADCTGCEACLNGCPQDAISMRPDWRGFMYPHIDALKCVDCGRCAQLCPANSAKPKPFTFPAVARAFRESDPRYLLQASSGGAFGVVARHVLSQGGAVFGCSMDRDTYKVHFIQVDSPEDLWKLHGSKYVQSGVGGIYRRVKEVLRSGRKALFCGCPCQVAALRAYLGRRQEGLVTIDLICHGVPSQPYFRAYVEDLTRRAQRPFLFRHKPELSGETRATSSTVIGFYHRDYYMTHFLWGKGYRRSCYRCRYAGGERPGDLTVGDFWNNKVARLPIDVSLGTSLVLFNSKQGEALMPLFSAAGDCLPLTTLHDAVGGDGGQLKHPCKNDFRTDLCYALWRLFGVRGPKAIFALEKKLFHLS